MRRILIFGNSGSGKSTLAKHLSVAESLALLDLDTVAWLPTTPPQRAPLADSTIQIEDFLASHHSWVIEGCYTDLLEIAQANATEIIFLNLTVNQCVANANHRPWEPHKYESPKAQEKNREMLIGWIKGYETRNDEFSYSSHMKFYEEFDGLKTIHTENNIL